MTNGHNTDTKIHVLLSLLFSMCLSHGYLPSALIKTTIVPIVKNKAGDLSDSNNYYYYLYYVHETVQHNMHITQGIKKTIKLQNT